MCYYHLELDIMSSCSICCEAFCCVKKCFLHTVCSYCNTKGCRCCNWGCGCRAGYTTRDIDNPMFRGYELREITEMYEYCLKCSAANFKSRECKYCEKLCSYAYIRCEGCHKRYHKSCSPKTFIPKYCYECERSPHMENKLKEQLKQ